MLSEVQNIVFIFAILKFLAYQLHQIVNTANVFAVPQGPILCVLGLHTSEMECSTVGLHTSEMESAQWPLAAVTANIINMITKTYNQV